MFRFIRIISAVIVFICAAPGASALTLYANHTLLYGIDAIDPNTGTLIKNCPQNKGNGRGVVVVGNFAYYTTADTNSVYKMDFTTCADLGVAFSVAGASALSTIAYDGTNFWIGDYSGTNHAFLYSPTGTLLKTISLVNCTGFCDGLEFFNGKLISNRGDNINAPYDVYDLNGVLLTPAFITPTLGAGVTGIAFDGTNFFVSYLSLGQVGVFNGTTGAHIRDMTVPAAGYEDLSFDYSIVIGPGPGATEVPTLSQWTLLVLGAIVLLTGMLLRRGSA
jgi:hypothetical protein